MSIRWKWALLALSPVLVACGEDNPLAIVGSWGGEGASVEVREGVTHFEFDCAHGLVEGVMDVSAGGRFEGTGTYTREGGPEPPEPRPAIPARFHGSVDGSRMTLEIDWLDGSGTTLGPDELRRNREPLLRKCL
jgi:hypothetical protein